MIKVSVIVPIYNVEPYFNRCLESIVGQTYINLEIILVDDGSPDNCPQLCDLWASRDSRIKVIHKKNGGLSSARNAGLDIATGDYISFVDSDDYIEKNMINCMVSAAQKYNTDVVCCGRIRVSNNKEEILFNSEEKIIFSSEQAIKELLCSGIIDEASWDKLYKADIFSSRRFPIGEINEDIVQTIEILGESSITHVGKALYYYCENMNSITKSKYNNNKKICLVHLDQIKVYLENNYPQLLEYFNMLELRYCQELLYLLLNDKKTLYENRSDYKDIMKRFRYAFIKTRGNGGYSNLDKIKGILIYFRLYFFLHYLMEKIK